MKLKTKKLKLPTKRPKYRYDMFGHGVTQSMMSLWLECREQCRLAYIEGWRPLGTSMALEYGTGMHWCQKEIYRHGKKYSTAKGLDLRKIVGKYGDVWSEEHRKAATDELAMHHQIMAMLDVVLPRYVARVSMKDKLYNDFAGKEWVQLEKPFRVLTGMGIPIQGQHDGIFMPKGKKELWLFESKNLSMIDEDAISDTLPVNLQVMVYLWAMMLMRDNGDLPKYPIKGVLYNVTRRPGQRWLTSDTLKSYIARVKADVDDPKKLDHYFLRFQMGVNEVDILNYVNHNIIPILCQMSNWYTSIMDVGPNNSQSHWMNPNALLTKYGRAGMYEPIVHGSFATCYRREIPFTELAG